MLAGLKAEVFEMVVVLAEVLEPDIGEGSEAGEPFKSFPEWEGEGHRNGGGGLMD